MGIKTIEYGSKFEHQLFPGPSFHWQTHEQIEAHEKAGLKAEGAEVQSHVHEAAVGVEGKDFAARAQMFFSLYFAMTGLHGIHVIIGILIMGTMVIMLKIDHPAMLDYMPTELAGLYWHFVDIVWIFLFPLYYLIPGG